MALKSHISAKVHKISCTKEFQNFWLPTEKETKTKTKKTQTTLKRPKNFSNKKIKNKN